VLDPNAHDRFVLRQRIKLAINQYEFSLAGPDGSEGEPFCFVEQARFKFKEDIRFYTDASKKQELLRILARQRFDPRARYDVTDDVGGRSGRSRRSSAPRCCARRSRSTTGRASGSSRSASAASGWPSGAAR
jgi:hypothetical protein